MKMSIYLYVFVLLVCFIGLLYNTNKLYEKNINKTERLVLALLFLLLAIAILATLHHLH